MQVNIKPGNKVTWTSQAGGSFKEKTGVVVGLVPRMTSANQFVPDGTLKSHRKFDQDYSTFDRAVVEVMGGAGGNGAAQYYAPRLSTIKLAVDNPRLSLSDLTNVSMYEEDTSVWIKDLQDNTVARAIVDMGDKNEVYGIWCTDPASWYSGSDYGKKWVAFKEKPSHLIKKEGAK